MPSTSHCMQILGQSVHGISGRHWAYETPGYGRMSARAHTHTRMNRKTDTHTHTHTDTHKRTLPQNPQRNISVKPITHEQKDRHTHAHTHGHTQENTPPKPTAQHLSETHQIHGTAFYREANNPSNRFLKS